MVYKFECSLTAQDCATLYDRSGDSYPKKAPFTNTSCVRDARLEGNVGRCGFPGAPCVLLPNGNDNCAGGGDPTDIDYNRICVPDSTGSRTGICRGEAGSVCTGKAECNWGMTCNITYIDWRFTPGVCGGANSYLNSSDEGTDGLDFARDYCLSGKADQDSTTGTWFCAHGPPMALTVAPPLSAPPLSGSSSSTFSSSSSASASSSSSTSSSSSSSTSSTSASSTFSSFSSTPLPTRTPTSTNIGVVVGPIAGVLAVIVLASYYLLRRRRSRREARPVSMEGGSSDFDYEEEEKMPAHARGEGHGSAGVGRDGGHDEPRDQDGEGHRPALEEHEKRPRKDLDAQYTDGREDRHPQSKRPETNSNVQTVKRRLEAQMDGSDGPSRL